ncbi:MAG TPA: CorA family divalent cation transporter [Candidatus Limnocylindria bacterium]
MTASPAREALRATLYDADGTDKTIDLDRAAAEQLGDKQLLWVDLARRERAEIEALAEAFDLPEEEVELLATDSSEVRLLRYPDRVHLRLLAVEEREGDERRAAALPTPTAIDIVVAANQVITAHDGEVSAFEAFREHIRGDSALGQLNAADFLTVLVDAVLDGYLELVEAVERRIDTLDEAALHTRDATRFLREVIGLRRRVALLRRSLAPHRWTFAALARPDFELEGLGRPWPGIVDRLERTVDSVENARELLIGTFDVYMASEAQRTNEVMKTLTILSAILLPAVVLAGVMGMNFRIDFFDNPANFWIAIGAMVAMAVVVLGIARWRGWI